MKMYVLISKLDGKKYGMTESTFAYIAEAIGTNKLQKKFDIVVKEFSDTEAVENVYINLWRDYADS